MLQLYGLSPVWTNLWAIREVACVNAFPQTSQLCGLSPVWISLCVRRWLTRVKAFPQTSQMCDLPRVWIFFCLLSAHACVNVFPNITTIWPIASVNQFMSSKTLCLCKRVSTNTKSMRPYTSMNQLVSSKINASSQTSQIFGLSIVWISYYLRSWIDRLNALSKNITAMWLIIIMQTLCEINWVKMHYHKHDTRESYHQYKWH